MDFTQTEAQRDLAMLTRKVLSDRLDNARLRDIESGQDRFDRTLWTELAGVDVLGATLPESIGGGGFGLLEQCSILIEMGRAVAPLPYLMSITAAASAIATFGDQSQRDQWARPAGAGEIVLTASLVEDGNPDPTQPTTHAQWTSQGWVVNGSKIAVAAGPIADFILVPASTDEGPVILVVAPSDEGVVLERQQVVDSDSEAWIELNNVRLDNARLLGEAGTGRRILDWLITRSTVGLCAAQLGVTERALELTAEYAGQRTQFDRPIGSFQAVSQRLADGYIDVEAIRLTMWQAAWRLSEGLSCGTAAATAKFWAADAGHRVAHTAVHVHGGVGLDLDHPLHRYFVVAKRHEFTLGAATAQLRHIGSTLAIGNDLD